MKVEFNCRYKRELSEEEKEEIAIQRLIKSEDDLPISTKYTYAKLTFDINDTKSFNYVDEHHTCIRFERGDSVVLYVSYAKFREMYILLTGHTVMTESNLEISK
jgi:hypothetical protein